MSKPFFENAEQIKELKNKIINLEFKYIKEMKHNSRIYEICRPNVEKGIKGEIVGDKICWWDNICADHRCCIPLKNLLIF